MRESREREAVGMREDTCLLDAACAGAYACVLKYTWSIMRKQLRQGGLAVHAPAWG